MYALRLAQTLARIRSGNEWDWLFLSALKIVAVGTYEKLSEYLYAEVFFAAAGRSYSEMSVYHNLTGGESDRVGGSWFWWRRVVEQIQEHEAFRR